jgi:hypothetical protein
MPSANPRGRPKGQNSLVAYYHDPDFFFIRHLRWERFCWELMEPPYTKTAAARKAGYSPKSARFIGCRLWKNPIIRDIFRRMVEIVKTTRKISEGVYLIPDYSGKYHIYRNEKYR